MVRDGRAIFILEQARQDAKITSMAANRSPADTVLPHVHYRNVPAAVAWLNKAFGFSEHYRYGEPGGAVSGAQMRLGKARIMLKDSRGRPTPADLGYGTQSLTVFVDDVDVHFASAKSAGATIVEDLHEMAYGERQYVSYDLDGHHLAVLAARARRESRRMGSNVGQPLNQTTERPPTVNL